MKVSEFMIKNVYFLNQDQTILEAAELMMKQNISALPIVDSNQHLVGIITESDFIGKDAHIPHALASIKRLLGEILYMDGTEEIFQRAKNKPLKKVMSKNIRTIGPDYSLDEVINMMNKYKLKRIPVVQDEKLVGIVTRHEVVRAFTMIKPVQELGL